MKHAFKTILTATAIAAGLAFAANAAAAAPAAQTKTVYIFADAMGVPGPDHKGHDAFVPDTMVVHVGQPVTVTFVNYDDMGHTFTAPGLHVNVMIKAGKHVAGSDKIVPTKTTYTFTPTKAGRFRYDCLMPCDPYSMHPSFDGPDRDGYMAGYVFVLN